MASNVELYNQSLHRKKNDLIAQACPATASCNETVLNAAIQAQGANADAALINAIGPSYVTIGAGSLSGAVSGALNLSDGTPYVGYGVSQTFKPSFVGTGIHGYSRLDSRRRRRQEYE